ncbi:MAG: medium chain dehydrogenase/reductase family protein [Patescibacteria group bacterium]
MLNSDFLAIELDKGSLNLVKKQVKENLSKNYLILKLLISGVCRSDLKEIKQLRTIRRDFGHEFIGEVISCSKGLKIGIGDWVVYDPHIKLKSRSSGFAEYLMAEGKIENLNNGFIKVPKKVSLRRLVFIEPLACANHCVNQLFKHLKIENASGLNIAIIGAGTAGSLIGLIIKHYGGHVIFFNRSSKRIDFMRENGLFNKNEYKKLSEKIEKKFDVVIPTTSFIFPSIMKKCLQIVKNNGVIHLFGGTKRSIKYKFLNQDIDKIRRKEKLVRFSYNDKRIKFSGTHGALTEDFVKAINYLSYKNQFSVEKIITAEVGLKQLPLILKTLSVSGGMGKTIVIPG